METDASDRAIRAVLNQIHKDRKLHPVVFHLQKFSPAELNYRITNKELLVIIDIFKQWRVYLEEAKHYIKVLIDYKNLIIFTITKVLNRQQIR